VKRKMSDEISVEDQRRAYRKSSKSSAESSGPKGQTGTKIGSAIWDIGKNLTGGSLEDIRARKYSSDKKRLQA
jgi:hypothetical protein